MHESSTNQSILDEGFELGIVIGKREALLIFGKQKFGVPTKTIQNALNDISDYAQFDILIDNLEHAKNWSELLRLWRRAR